MEVTAEQVIAVLQQRAASDRLIAEILRAAAIEASIIQQQQDTETDNLGGEDESG